MSWGEGFGLGLSGLPSCGLLWVIEDFGSQRGSFFYKDFLAAALSISREKAPYC